MLEQEEEEETIEESHKQLVRLYGSKLPEIYIEGEEEEEDEAKKQHKPLSFIEVNRVSPTQLRFGIECEGDHQQYNTIRCIPVDVIKSRFDPTERKKNDYQPIHYQAIHKYQLNIQEVTTGVNCPGPTPRPFEGSSHHHQTLGLRFSLYITSTEQSCIDICATCLSTICIHGRGYRFIRSNKRQLNNPSRITKKKHKTKK